MALTVKNDDLTLDEALGLYIQFEIVTPSDKELLRFSTSDGSIFRL